MIDMIRHDTLTRPNIPAKIVRSRLAPNPMTFIKVFDTIAFSIVIVFYLVLVV